jgi:subfamily B ATP-binding cassette protein MsbA
MLGVAATTAASAYLIKPVLDDVFINKKAGMLKFLSIVVLLVFLIKGLSSWGHTYLMSYVGQSIVTRLRQQLYDHLQRLSLSFFDRIPTGLLMSRITNDVNLIQGAVSNAVTGLLKDFFSIIGLMVVIFYRDWKLALMAMLVLPVAFFPIVKFGRMLRRISTKSQESIGDISVILHETISGNRIVKAFGMEQYEKERFSKENIKYFRYLMKSISVNALSSPLMEFLGGVGIVFIIWYGGYNVIRGVSTPGNFFSFLAALLMLYEPVKRLSGMNNIIQQGLAGAQRVYDILDTPPEIEDRADALDLRPIQDKLELRSVQFSYEILIDDMDIRDVKVASLRDQIGMVTQQTILFNDTVRNNIAYGDIRKSNEEIVTAAKAANAHDFIMKMEQGYDTIIGEQGVRLSGGQRQRLCIARALLKNAPILILDEATSSLDSEAELEVQKALETLMVGRTTLVIAHRLSTIQNADRIVVLADGRIVEEGQHDELLKAGGEYRRLYDLQFARLVEAEDSGEALLFTG